MLNNKAPAKGSWEEYFVAWKKRARQIRQKTRAKEIEARKAAREMARVLAEEFAVSRVYLIGSLTRPGYFTSHSDIDLVVEGLPPEKFYQAERRLEDIATIPFDLIDWAELDERFAARVRREGVILYDRDQR
ncbi:MAG: nucleotidyltransferase domain-containing protein [Bacillota bacterium]